MGHAPHPTQSLVNSCEEFYQAKQLFILTQGNWHVLAKLQKVSSVPKCKNILRIAKKKLQGDRVQIKFVLWFMARNIYVHKHIQSRIVCCRFDFANAPYEEVWSHWEHWHTEAPSSVSWRQSASAENSIQSTYKLGLENGFPLSAKWEAVSLLFYFPLVILASAISIKLILVCNNPLAWWGLNITMQNKVKKKMSKENYIYSSNAHTV